MDEIEAAIRDGAALALRKAAERIKDERTAELLADLADEIERGE